jgi:hypothetical protein
MFKVNSHPWLALFFAFGASMCALTVCLLLSPGSGLDVVWRANPEAHAVLQSFGKWSVVLMCGAWTACGLAAVGLWQGTRWGVQVGIAVLSVNLIGDVFNTIVRHDHRALIGLPIAGAMIWHLSRDLR